MQSTNIPTKIPLPFANAAGGSYVNTIPVASQIGITNGRASLADGFPPLTFTPISAGGVPPFGSDMNGILKEITAIQQWQEAGGFFPFDSNFATTIGGYPKGAILQSSTFNGLWVSTIENNSNNPDTTGTGWTSLTFEGAQPITISSTTTTLTYLQAAYPILIFSGALTTASTVIVPTQAGEWIVVNNTTGAYNLTIKTASGTGVPVLQNYSTYIYCDGTNVNYANSAAVNSFNGRTGTVTLNATDVTNALGYTPANINSPNFTGTPTAPNSTNEVPNTNIANTAFAIANGLGGSAQTLTNVTSSRSYGVTYTNSTNLPIFVSVVNSYGVSSSCQSYVNGVNVVFFSPSGTGTSTSTHTYIVPPGGTYKTLISEGSAAIAAWYEIR